MADPELYGVRLRPHQAAVLAYQAGRMAVSAVPGSGKTTVLALLAARLILEGHIGDEGEVLVVTVQNSAVDNIAQRIRNILLQQKLPPVGFRVCTLHKLANDIIRQRHDLAGVENDLRIIDDEEARRTMHNAVEAWIAGHRGWWASFLPEASENQRAKTAERWHDETERVGREVAKLCKHLRKTPQEALAILTQSRTQDLSGRDEFLHMGIELYAQYQRYMQMRSGLDFDDLIWRAIDALEQDASYLANLRLRWPYILEDEAQDSSPLQESILARLAGEEGNWVRMGDPNQAINSTFTAANPLYFRRFGQQPGVQSLTLPESGRCGRPIMAFANALVRWACDAHPDETVRTMAFLPQEIMPTGPDDKQQNPPDAECHIHLQEPAFEETGAEAQKVAIWGVAYVQRYPARTVAVLCPAGWQGNKVVEALQGMTPAVPYDDLLKSTPQTRSVAKVLAAACAYLGDPTRRRVLSRLYAVLAEAGHTGNVATRKRLRQQRTLLDSLAPHNLLFPHSAVHLHEMLPQGVELLAEDALALEQFAALTSRWVRATDLPVDQLILTIAQDLFRKPEELAICHSVASSLRATGAMHPDWRLNRFAEELAEVAANRRAFSNLSLADAGYVPQKGRLVVTTMHKAKGLEWDAVYLMCVDDLEFPSSTEDVFRDEPYYMLGRAPAVEARKRLEQLAAKEFVTPVERSLVQQARIEYIAERLRLLYVGITRAKRDLALTYSATAGTRKLGPALALAALRRMKDEGLALNGVKG